MTKVLAFCDYLQEPMGGGAEIVSAEVYRRLASSGDLSITVLSGVNGRAGYNAVAGPDVEIRQSWGLDLSRLLGAQTSVAPGLMGKALQAVRKNRPDVIHASSIHFFGSIVAAVVASVARIPLVTTCHVSGIDALPGRTRRAAAFHEKTVGRFILSRSESVIAVSQAVANHVVSLDVDADRIEIVENGVDPDRFFPGTREDSQVVITFVGRLIENKGPLMLMDAFSQLSEQSLRLRIVGTGPQHEQVLARARQDARVEVLGHRADTEAILATSDVFVRPSTTEGRSLAVLEAMAAGCAVVATSIPANAELIDPEHTGLLTPCGDAKALAARLHRLANDAGLRGRLGAAAREQALLRSWDATAAETGEVLRRAARSAP